MKIEHLKVKPEVGRETDSIDIGACSNISAINTLPISGLTTGASTRSIVIVIFIFFAVDCGSFVIQIYAPFP